MKKIHLLLLVSSAIISQSISAAILTVYNETNKPIEVTAIFSSSSKSTKKTIEAGKNVTINSGIHSFRQLEWRHVGDGMHHKLDISSTRTMLKGKIAIGENGSYRINFNAKGVYPRLGTETGNASSARVNTPTYPKPVKA